MEIWKLKTVVGFVLFLNCCFLNAETDWIRQNQQMIQWVKSGQPKKAVEMGGILLRDIRKENQKNGKVSADAIVFLVNQGIICKQIREYAAAREALEFAAECKIKIASQNDPLFVAIYKSLGEIFQELKDFEQGEKYFLQALKIKEINLGGDNAELVPLYVSVADFYLKAGKNNESLGFYEKALKICSLKNDNDDKTARIQFKLGEFYYKEKDYEKAKQSFLIAFNIYDRNKDYKNMADIYDYLGTLNMLKGLMDEAESSYRLAIKNNELSSGKDSIEYAKSLNNLGKIYIMNNKKEAEVLLKESLSIRERLLGKDHPSLVVVLKNLQDFYLKNSNPLEAEKIKAQLLRIRKNNNDNEQDS